ncbi:MAG: septum formation protein Maf [Chitinophagaceae bacterium]|nr:septum formation protein Maf [Oligoflexus sp.]
MKINHLVLASTSSYRRALLNQVGINHRPMAPNVDEDAITAETPEELARKRSEAKGLSLAFTGENFIAIAADQVLDFFGTAYGKAESREEAHNRLCLFAGNWHVLHSAYTLVAYTAAGPRLLKTRVDSAKMSMRPLSDEEIEAYLDTAEWEGCAGCYQYENKGMNLFGEMEGDLSTVIGLCLPSLLEELRALQINVLVNASGPWDVELED